MRVVVLVQVRFPHRCGTERASRPPFGQEHRISEGYGIDHTLHSKIRGRRTATSRAFAKP